MHRHEDLRPVALLGFDTGRCDGPDGFCLRSLNQRDELLRIVLDLGIERTGGRLKDPLRVGLGFSSTDGGQVQRTLSADLKEQRPPLLGLPHLVASVAQPAGETTQHEQDRQPCGHGRAWLPYVSVPSWLCRRARVVGWPLRHTIDGYGCYVCVELRRLRFGCERVSAAPQEL